MQSVEKTIYVKAPIDVFYRVITDYECYPDFIQEMVRVQVLSRQAQQVEVLYVLKAVIKEIQYTLHLTEQPKNRLSWTLVEGQMMKINEGFWNLEPVSPTETKATYHLEIGLKSLLIPQSVVNTLVHVTLPKTMDAFKQRAESLVLNKS